MADNETIKGGEVSPPAKSHPDGQRSEGTDAPEFFDENATEHPVAFGRGVRCVGRRVDALVVAFKIEVASAIFDHINTRQGLANRFGAAELQIGDFCVALKRRRKPGVPFENADVRGIYDPDASGGFVLELTARASFLATHSLDEAVTLFFRIAGAFGVSRASRLRRVDLAADYAGFQLCAGDIDRVLTTRAGLQAFRPDAKDLDQEKLHKLREHRDSALRVTGITVAAGNPVMARVYAKDVELRLPGREEKRAIEHRIWRDHGWDGTASVTRVEFQCRGAFLDETQLRNPRTLEANLDGVFQHCVRWLRFIDPDTSPRRTRCELDPRWEVVASTVFTHEAAPCARSRRHRGGARPSHVSGAVQSALASIGLLRPPELMTPEDEVFDDEEQFIAALDPVGAETWVRQQYQEMFGAGSDLCARDAITRFGPHGAVRAAIARRKAAIARFSSTDPTPPDGENEK